jgi:hypothetical protein
MESTVLNPGKHLQARKMSEKNEPTSCSRKALQSEGEKNPDVGYAKIPSHMFGTSYERVFKSSGRRPRLFFSSQEKKHNALDTRSVGHEIYVSEHFACPFHALFNGTRIAYVLITRGQLAHRPFAGSALLAVFMSTCLNMQSGARTEGRYHSLRETELLNSVRSAARTDRLER